MLASHLARRFERVRERLSGEEEEEEAEGGMAVGGRPRRTLVLPPLRPCSPYHDSLSTPSRLPMSEPIPEEELEVFRRFVCHTTAWPHTLLLTSASDSQAVAS